MNATANDLRFYVGLTGGIGSGKSTVARLFAVLGVNVVDTDDIAHQLTQAQGLAIPLIRADFGAEYITTTGSLDRTRMRQLIFTESAAKQKLIGKAVGLSIFIERAPGGRRISEILEIKGYESNNNQYKKEVIYHA